MRGDMIKLLQYEAERRPEIADLVSRVNTLTDADIENAKVPLKWYKIALRRLRDMNCAENIADQMEANSIHSPSVVYGEIRSISETSSLGLSHYKMDMDAGDLIFLPTTGGIWVGSQFFERYDPEIISRSISKATGSREDYIEMYQNYVRAKLGPVPTEDERPLFRIVRH